MISCCSNGLVRTSLSNFDTVSVSPKCLYRPYFSTRASTNRSHSRITSAATTTISGMIQCASTGPNLPHDFLLSAASLWVVSIAVRGL